MKNLRNFVMLALLAAVAVYATVALQTPPKTVPQSGELAFPDLLEKLNDTTSIEGASGGETFELTAKDGRWVVPDKDDYAASSQSVRQLLLGVASLERVEPKTSNPELYEKLGLVDPSDAASDARLFSLRDAGGAPLAELIVGDSKPSRSDPLLTEYYVRFPGDDQSWLVQGKLPSGKSAPDWIDKTIVDIDAVRVRSVSVAHPDGETVTVSKAQADDQDFTLEDLPEGVEVKDRWRVNDIGRGLASLELDDVKRGAGDEQTTEPAYTVTLHTFDGLVVELAAVKASDATVGTFKARFEVVGPAAGEDTQAGEDGKSDESDATAEEDEGQGDAVEQEGAGQETAEEDGAEEDDELGPETVRAEAEALNAKWEGWRYTLPEYKADQFARKRADLIEKPDIEGALDELESPTSGGAPAPAASEAQTSGSSSEPASE